MIKEKYINIVKSRVDIVQLMEDLYPDVSLVGRGLRRKCCCVFHKEKTPSLLLDLKSDRYHCFGCKRGGDLIQLVEDSKGLTFDDAVRYLLEQYCPEVELKDIYEKLDPEKESEFKKRETMYLYNRYASEFFIEQYNANTAEAEKCRKYAEWSDEYPDGGRWSKDFCRTFGLGYSPAQGNQFLAYAKSKGLNLDILLELGLIAEDDKHPGYYYDFYRGRLMIPQRDKYGRILTFTARALSVSNCKYLNGRDSLIYKKSQSIFGIDVAMKAACQLGKVFLVEGAPDVMRLQSLGITNVVATLGGVWSKEQLNVFSKFGCSLCFIPDSDVPKEGCQYGAGDLFVFKNGTLATEMGFHILVREIPLIDGQKQDADSYIKDLSIWETMAEKDFILWYAEKHYKKDGTNDEQLKTINDTCDLLVNVPSETLQDSLLNDLKNSYKKPSIWKSAFADAARRKRERLRKRAVKQSDELDGFGFYQRDYHYYDIDNYGKEREWSNFVIRPLFLIVDDKKPTRIFELENENRVKKTIELQQADVTRLDRFKEQIEGRGNYRFFEKPDKYELLKAYFYEKMEEAQRVYQMGWNDLGNKGFYAFCNGIVYEGKWQPVDEYGMIRVDSEVFYLPAMSKIHRHNRGAFMNERRFMHDPKQKVQMEDYFCLIADLYGDNGIVGICFYLATLFRDIIIDSTRSFPILNIYGKKGTGKTEFAISLINLFQRSPEVSNLDSTTYYALGDKCAEVCNMIVHFDEYKNSLSNKHIDFLKGIYDCAGRTKRSADGERRESTSVNCGVMLTGQEMPTADIALFSRVIFLESQKSERTPEEAARFRKLVELRNLCPTNITVELIRYRDNFNANWHSAWERALGDIKSETDNIGERFINNWAMMLAAYYCLSPVVKDLPFNVVQVREICKRGIRYQYGLCNSSDEIAVFWSLFAKARQLGDVKEGFDYKIGMVTSLKLGTNKIIEFREPTELLFLRQKICFAKAKIQAKREGTTMIPEDSLLTYLVSTSGYYGKTKSPLKFYVSDETGNAMKRQDTSELLYDQERALVFDYAIICSNYDISLHTVKEETKKQNIDEE